MKTPDMDTRSPKRRAQDEHIALETPLAPLDLPADANPLPVEAWLKKSKERPQVFVGVVENGLVRSLDPLVQIPDHTRVLVVASENEPVQASNSRPAENSQGFVKELERIYAKFSQSKDQIFACLRDEYLRLGPTERQSFREWVEKLSTIKLPAGLPLQAMAKITILIQKGEDCDEVGASSQALGDALHAWDEGRDFIPGILNG